MARVAMSGRVRADGTMTGAAETYGGVLQAFHWTIVALVTIQFVTKLILPGIVGKAGMHTVNAWHLGTGSTILLLMLLRLTWRLTHHVPPPPADLSPGLRLLSRANHWAFYALLIVLPLGGWMAANGFGATVKLAGIISLPAIAPKNAAMAEQIGDLHGTLAFVLLALIALHVSGAIYHGVMKRDGVVGRMLPRGA